MSQGAPEPAESGVFSWSDDDFSQHTEDIEPEEDDQNLMQELIQFYQILQDGEPREEELTDAELEVIDAMLRLGEIPGLYRLGSVDTPDSICANDEADCATTLTPDQVPCPSPQKTGCNFSFCPLCDSSSS